MKRIILLVVLTGLLTVQGCVNNALLKSYTAYQNTVGKEYERFLDKGKNPDGKKYTKDELTARRLNVKTSKAVLIEVNK